MRRYNCVIKRWEENRRFDFTAEAPGFSRLQAEWELVPEGNGCRFTMREQINVQKANWLVDRLFVQRGLAHKHCEGGADLTSRVFASMIVL